MSKLRPDAEQKFNAYLTQVGKAFGKENFVGNIDGTNSFTATPSIEQKLVEKLVEYGGWFMPYFNMYPVSELKGEKISMSLSGAVSSRTDTTGAGVRSGTNLLTLENTGYELFQVDRDVNIRYSQIDTWAKFPNFQAMYNAQIKKQIAADMIRCGWHGTSHAATTDRSANPNLEDLNIGWLQLLRAFNSGSQVLAGTSQEPIVLGGVDFPNLDTLVNDALDHIPDHLQMDMIALVSRDLISAQRGTYYADNGGKGLEKVAIAQNKGTVLETFGGLNVVTPPFFGNGKVLVMPRDALSFYYQSGSVRRTVKDMPEKNGIVEFNSQNEGYVVENELACFLVEGITIQ